MQTYLKREFDIGELKDVNLKMIQSYVDNLILSERKESYESSEMIEGIHPYSYNTIKLNSFFYR